MSYLEELREHVKNRKRPPAPSVKSIKTPEKGTSDTFDTTPLGPFPVFGGFTDPRHAASARLQSPPLDRPRRLWLIRHDDGRLVSHSFTPAATEAQVRSWYPGGLSIEAEEGSLS